MTQNEKNRKGNDEVNIENNESDILEQGVCKWESNSSGQGYYHCIWFVGISWFFVTCLWYIFETEWSEEEQWQEN